MFTKKVEAQNAMETTGQNYLQCEPLVEIILWIGYQLIFDIHTFDCFEVVSWYLLFVI